MSNIVTIATVISSITVICSTLFAVYKQIRKVDELKEDFQENMLLTLKLVIMNDKIPIEEKLEAGRKYIQRGGNGAVKQYIHDLEQQEYNQIYKEV